MSTQGDKAKSDDIRTEEANNGTTGSRGLFHEHEHHHKTGSSSQGDRQDEKPCRSLGGIASAEITPHKTTDQGDDALNLGLSPEDTIDAHIRLGNDWSALNDDSEATLHYDCALELAQKYRDRLDADSLSILYRNISARYIQQAKQIRSREGLDNCFVYLEAKQGLLNGWASPGLYLELGNIYDEKCPFEFDKIGFYYAKASECKVLDREDEVAVQTARQNLRIIEKERAYFAARQHLPIIGEPPRRKDYSKLALITGSGMLLLLAGLLARPNVRVGVLHPPVTGKTGDSVDNGEAGNQPQPAAVRPVTTTPVVDTKVSGNPEAVPPVVATETSRNKESMALSTARRAVKAETRRPGRAVTMKRTRPVVNIAARPKKDTGQWKAQRKSFAPPSRKDL